MPSIRNPNYPIYSSKSPHSNMWLALSVFLIFVRLTCAESEVYNHGSFDQFEMTKTGFLDDWPMIITEDARGFKILWVDLETKVVRPLPKEVVNEMMGWASDYYKRHARNRRIRDCRVFENKPLGRYICSPKHPVRATSEEFGSLYKLTAVAKYSRELSDLISSACTVFERERLCVSWTNNLKTLVSAAEYKQLVKDCNLCSKEGESCRYWMETHEETEVFCVSNMAHGCNMQVVC